MPGEANTGQRRGNTARAGKGTGCWPGAALQPGELAYFACRPRNGLGGTAGTRWAIEECFEEAKGQVGRPVRCGGGTAYRHITLACWRRRIWSIAMNQEKRGLLVPMKTDSHNGPAEHKAAHPTGAWSAENQRY